MDDARRITAALVADPFGALFLDPVDPVKDNAPDYQQRIKHPMDLRAIEGKLAAGVYAKWDEWAADVELIFDNCLAYNGLGSDVGAIGEFLRKRFHKMVMPLKVKNYDGWIDHCLTLYRRMLESLENAPNPIRRVLSTDMSDETASMTDAEYDTLALKLSLLNGPEIIPILELLSEVGIDVSRRKPGFINVKTLPSRVAGLLANYLKEIAPPKEEKSDRRRPLTIRLSPSSELLKGRR
jgi:hypothetical protein